jgi:hypothetical protein
VHVLLHGERLIDNQFLSTCSPTCLQLLFFNEPAISANVYLDMLELYSEEFQPWIIFQQDGAHPHWGSHVRRFLDATFPIRWIGRDGLTPGSPRSPVITPPPPPDFFLWGFVKDKVYYTYSSFLVIDVCNQGKTLCSPCMFP